MKEESLLLLSNLQKLINQVVLIDYIIIILEGEGLSTTEQTHQQDLERLKLFRYMDDDFMTACLEDNYEAVELILRIVLGQEDITIKSIRVQDSMKNLQGRSAILDVHAVDNTGKEFDCEIQRSDKGAGVKRARHNSSLLDAHILKPGEDTENIPDTYVIFITENDVMKGKQPIYQTNLPQLLYPSSPDPVKA